MFIPLKATYSTIVRMCGVILICAMFSNCTNDKSTGQQNTGSDTVLKAQYRKYIDSAYYYTNANLDLSKAKLYSDSLYELFKDKSKVYKVEYASALFTRADLYMAQKNYNRAFREYYAGRQFVRTNLDSCKSFDFTNMLGGTRFNQGQYAKAIPYYKQAIIEINTCDDAKKLTFASSTNNSIAICFERIGQLDSALIYYQKGLDIVNKYTHQIFGEKTASISKGVFFGNIGGTYLKMGKKTEAEKYLKASIKINDADSMDRQDAQTAKLKLADLYIHTSQFKEADTLLNQMERYFIKSWKNSRNEETRIKWYKLKWMYANQKGDVKQAYNYLQKYNAIQDSTYLANKAIQNADMEMAFKESEQLSKLAEMDKVNREKNTILFIVIGFLGTALLVLVITWLNRKRLEKLNKAVTLQKENALASLKALQQSHEENKRIIKVISHDLRNPMSANISIISLLMENDYILPKDREMMEILKTSNFRYLELIKDLMDVDPVTKELSKEPIELKFLLENCIEVLRFKAVAKNQQLILVAQETTINLNREKIWRVISNLIANAIKFSPNGEEIKIELQQQKTSVVISVIDHGIGIPDEDKDKIFKTFTDARRVGTSGEESFGLGLAISQQIIEAHEGKIWFESELGKGSTFFIELPFDH